MKKEILSTITLSNMKLSVDQLLTLGAKLPEWAIKKHPTKSNMSVIHPMAVIDRLNEVFGIGGWQTRTDFIKSYEWMQATKAGERKVFTATCKMILDIPGCEIHLEQYGGSTNDDEGDAMKGSATDGLTKIASYLGIGAEIYKGKGNIDAGEESEKKQGVVENIHARNDEPF